jgi:hypothetical protein
LEELVTNDNHDIKDNWTTLKMDQRTNSRVIHVIQKMNEDRDKLVLKKANSKYITAKKKYSKKNSADIEMLRKKFDFETCEELGYDNYCLTAAIT